MKFPETKKYIVRRIAATVIDYSLVFAITIYYIYVVGTPNDEGGYSVTGLPAFGPLLFWFFYFVIAEFALDGTVGHQIFHLKIVTVDNRPLTFGQVILRRISDALEISWCFGLIAFILVKNTDYNQRLGDIWAKTLVTGKDESFS